MFRTIILVSIIALICMSTVQAEVVIETVTVGNQGNPGEQSRLPYDDTTYYGGVDYTYNIGTFEVTAGQYRDFLNAVDPAGSNPYGLYSSAMDSGSYGCQITWNAGLSTYDFSGRPSGTEADWVNRPVNYVSWSDSARFSNWMHNGQGSGDTETGSYLLNGAMTNQELMAITREPGATWVIPSEDEWYKAAYYDGGSGVYYDYPTSSDSVPNNDLIDPDPGNNATFYISGAGYTIGSPYWRTDVGAHENSDSPYGTSDQGGNVWEWNEAILYGSYRGLRGGSFSSVYDVYLHAALRDDYDPTGESSYLGFRVAEVPEPATLGLLGLGGVVLLRRRGR